MESALRNPLVRAAISCGLLLAGYTAMESSSNASYERMGRDVPRCRGFEFDPVFDSELEWRRRLCALDAFARSALRPPAPAWSLALADAGARLVRLRAALCGPEAAGVALPPAVAGAARVCALRIFECLTALEHIVLEVARRALQAPSVDDTGRLLQGLAAHEIEHGVVIDTMPREIMDMYKRFIALAQELKEVTDNELVSVDRLRAMRAAEGAQYHAHAPEHLLRALNDALAIESAMSTSASSEPEAPKA
jgi:hypothetical protein